MKKLLIIIITLVFINLEPAFSQKSYELGIQQPPIILIDFYPYTTIFLTIGEEFNLDDLFTVYSDISYTRQWKFRQGSVVKQIDDPLITITEHGVLFLTVINEFGCSYYDSVYLYARTTGIGDIEFDRGNTQSIKIYPNPNSGTFDITISECQPGLTIEMINSAGVQLLSQILECSTDVYSGKIIMPSVRSGTYFILVKEGNRIIYRKKVIILK